MVVGTRQSSHVADKAAAIVRIRLRVEKLYLPAAPGLAGSYVAELWLAKLDRTQ